MMNKIIKNFVFQLIIVSVLFSSSFASPRSETPQVDESKKIYDYADLFNSVEEESLFELVNDFIEKQNLDMAIVTINTNNKSSARAYADDFYDYNNFGKNSTYDGLLFLIDMDNREMYISTTGNAILIYDDNRIERILDSTYEKIAVQDYYGCAEKFVERAESYANCGVPSSNSDAYIDANGHYRKHYTQETFAVCITISIVVTIFFMIIALSQHRTIKRATNAKMYVKVKHILNREDIFLDTHTSRVYVSSSSSSSGSSRGGSSTHRSSSGRSHGGGGRRF